MYPKSPSLIFLAIALGLFPAVARGHFLWLDCDADKGKVHVYFSEAGEPELLKLIAGAKVWQCNRADSFNQLKLAQGKESLVGTADDSARGLFLLQHDYGVFSRGEKSMYLKYYAKTGPALGSPAWNIDTGKRLALDITPRPNGQNIDLTVRWQGKPLQGAEVTVDGPGLKLIESKSNAKGQLRFPLGKPGTYSIRARHVEDKAGEKNGKKFDNTRHYATLTFMIDQSAAASDTAQGTRLPDVPNPVTSFGGAVIGDNVYIYGGHEGDPHDYYLEGQSKTLWRLNLQGRPQWKAVAQGPSLQGLAMVAHNGRLFRLGGFTARNKQGDDPDLWSTASAASIDPAAGKWSPLPDLPEPRSSFDAAVGDGKIYVVGGWQLRGDEKQAWHKTAHVLDLSQKKPAWKALPAPPFQRRALSVAAFNNKIYAIGGMTPKGPSTKVDVLDLSTQSWSEGPPLPGKGMEGFGSSAFATGGRLYVSTYSGSLLRLAKDGKQWEPVQKLERDRFFHRMLPIAKNRLILVGGASMETGKFKEVDVVEVK